MSVKIFYRKNEYTVESGKTIKHLLLRLEISSGSVIPTRRGKLVDEDEILEDGDIIRLVPVITGG
jgi:sulfur carrier protein ThiS